MEEEIQETPNLEAKWDQRIYFDSVVIFGGNSRDLHDSGYRSIYFVLCDGRKPLGKFGGPNVALLGGITGKGHVSKWPAKGLPRLIPPVDWSIDCLPKSGLLRLFAPMHKLFIEWPPCSSFEIFAEERER